MKTKPIKTPRNPEFVFAKKLKAGAHGVKSNKDKRRAAKLALRKDPLNQ